MSAPITAAAGAIRVDDQWLDDLPDDLYIPPEAFAILLERFEGPLDFLLYLVKKNGLDLRTLDIAPIASQYLSYIKLMHTLDVELAADYLVMAALLADLKSRLLLPKPVATPDIEHDPRRDLLARLEAYAGIKATATQLGRQPVLERDVYRAAALRPESDPQAQTQVYSVQSLADAMRALLGKPVVRVHAVRHETVQLEERLAAVLWAVQQQDCVRFDHIVRPEQGRIGIVVTFMAILELLRQRKIQLIDDGAHDAPLTIGSVRHAA